MNAANSHRPVLGALMLAGGLLLFALQDVLVKDVSTRIPVVQILTLRIVVVVLIVYAIYRLSGVGAQPLSRSEQMVLCLRGLLAFLAFTSFYMALARIPMASVSAVYMSAPLFVTALSVPLLRETVGWRRWFAVLIGFAGVLIIVKPGPGLFQSAALLPVVSAFFYSFIPIITRSTRMQLSVTTITLYNTATYLMCCLLLSLAIFMFPADERSLLMWQALARTWTAPELLDWLKIVVSGVIFTGGVYALTSAYRQAAVSVVAPFEYSYLLWSVLLGFLVFSEVPATRVILGAVTILLCGLYILYRERSLPTRVR